MTIDVDILDGALPDDAAAWRVPGAGAVVSFEGVVRPEEGGRPIDGLTYDAYEPMAQRQLQRLGEEAAQRWGLLALRVRHSRGVVPAGTCSFRLQIASPHRKEALAAMDWFIDQLKIEVPIWKRACEAAIPCDEARR